MAGDVKIALCCSSLSSARSARGKWRVRSTGQVAALKKATARGYQLNCTGPIVGFIGSEAVDSEGPGIDI